MITAIILALVGLGFVLAEVFFPSLGVFGIIAGACIIMANVLAFEEGDLTGYTFMVASVVLVLITKSSTNSSSVQRVPAGLGAYVAAAASSVTLTSSPSDPLVGLASFSALSSSPLLKPNPKPRAMAAIATTPTNAATFLLLPLP